MPSLTDRFRYAFNAFFNKDPTGGMVRYGNSISTSKPDRVRLPGGNADRALVTSIYNRIANDVASTTFKHAYVDEDGRYVDTIYSGLNRCLTLRANKDQTARRFIQDIVLSMFGEATVCIVPIDCSASPLKTSSYDIYSMRTGKILQYYPDHVLVRVYNDRNGNFENLLRPKTSVAIIENPFGEVMNAPNGTVKRLLRTMAMLDKINDNNTSGKLDIIIQLPYLLKTDAKRAEAERRRKEIEQQLAGSKYGVAYIDGTEKITQLNRSLENQLSAQIAELKAELFTQLGLTPEIMNGTADDKVMLNYFNRTIEPIVSEIRDNLVWSFLSKKAQAIGQSIVFFRDPFRLTPVTDLAEIADKFTRNEIMTSNEFRSLIGMKPSDDPRADELRNKNINQSNEEAHQMYGEQPEYEEYQEDT